MIVDCHAHLGWDEVFDEDFTEDELLESQRQNGVDVTLVQPALTHSLATVQRYHDAIAELARRRPGRFFGIANPNPHLPQEDYRREVRRCIEQAGFKGLKLHPMAHAVNPLGRCGQSAFALAHEMNLPVIVHTGAGIPWAAPSLLQGVAERYPGLPLVVAHAGGMILAGEAGELAARCPNVYLECSWSGGFLVRHWVRSLGAARVLFGSDHASNAVTELAKFRALNLNPEELAAVLGGTAARVFKLPGS